MFAINCKIYLTSVSNVTLVSIGKHSPCRPIGEICGENIVFINRVDLRG